MIDRGLRAMEWWFSEEGNMGDNQWQKDLVTPGKSVRFGGRPFEETMRTFDTGATRDSEEGKIDYEGALSALVVERFGRYMADHREQSDGTSRTADNWQKGITLSSYMKSAYRHFMDVWMCHRGWRTGVEEALCGVLFNIMGYLHVVLVEKREGEEKERQHILEDLDRKIDAEAAMVRDFE